VKRALAIGMFAIAAVACRPESGRYAGHAVHDLHRSVRDVVASVASSFSRNVSAQQEDAGSPRSAAPLTILQINDVYSTVPVNGLGGLARVATLKQQMIAQGRVPLLLLAGDFLSSSVESTVFKGEQMVAALNAAGLDLATLGNHEFDFGVDLLIQRMHEAKWQWVVSNVLDVQTGKPVGGAEPYVVRTFGPLKVGFIGLCLTTEGIGRDKLARIRLIDPLEAAATYLPALKAAQVDVIVAVTHLNFADDRALAERFPDIDVIIGGHEHYPITATENRTLISKAGSDAKFVARIDVNRRTARPVERFFELIPITSAIAEEPRTAAVVKSYEDRMGTALATVVGSARVPLDGVALHLRSGETNLGDMVADSARLDAEADIAILNAGGLRGDRVHPPGPLTRRSLVEILPFTNVICKVAVPGRVVLQALNSGVSRLPAAAGQFPQVSGLSMRVEVSAPVGDRVRDVKVLGQPLDPDKIYTVALPDYVLLGGDGYTMFADQRVLTDPESGTLMVAALEKYVAARSEVSPMVEGRITISR
jgi:5'-nucleotidase